MVHLRDSRKLDSFDVEKCDWKPLFWGRRAKTQGFIGGLSVWRRSSNWRKDSPRTGFVVPRRLVASLNRRLAIDVSASSTTCTHASLPSSRPLSSIAFQPEFMFPARFLGPLADLGCGTILDPAHGGRRFTAAKFPGSPPVTPMPVYLYTPTPFPRDVLSSSGSIFLSFHGHLGHRPPLQRSPCVHLSIGLGAITREVLSLVVICVATAIAPTRSQSWFRARECTIGTSRW